MGIFWYHIYVKCENCLQPCDIRIRKGLSVANAVKLKVIRCSECGIKLDITEYETEFGK